MTRGAPSGVAVQRDDDGVREPEVEVLAAGGEPGGPRGRCQRL